MRKELLRDLIERTDPLDHLADAMDTLLSRSIDVRYKRIMQNLRVVFRSDNTDPDLHPELQIMVESILARDKSSSYIGTSELPCYMCYQFSVYANLQGYRFKLDGTTGRVEPWRPPKTEDPEIYIITHGAVTALVIALNNAMEAKGVKLDDKVLLSP
jgi:OTT_1508-like deaminase